MRPVAAVVHELTRLAGEAAKADACSLFLVDSSRTVLQPAVVIGLPHSYIAGCGDVRIGTQCCGRAVSTGAPFIVEDMLTDPLFADARAAAEASGIRAAFSVPVRGRGGKVLASLACHYHRIYKPTNVDIERNELYAKLIGFALQESAGAHPLRPSADDSRPSPASL